MLSHTSRRTNVTRSTFFTRKMDNLLEWSCIIMYNSEGNLVLGNTIISSPDFSKMYVAISIFSEEEGTVLRSNGVEKCVIAQNFIKLFSEGYAIHAYPLIDPPVTVCASNIVTDTSYARPSNVKLDWSC